MSFTKNLSITIYHFAGQKPEQACEHISGQEEPCRVYQSYADKVLNMPTK